MPATRTKDSATLRKTHDKSDAMATQSDVRRLLRLPALFASKKAASCCKILANRTQRSRRTTRFCTKENKNTFQKSSAAFTTPATTKAGDGGTRARLAARDRAADRAADEVRRRERERQAREQGEQTENQPPRVRPRQRQETAETGFPG
jgi:hypothetical protein